MANHIYYAIQNCRVIPATDPALTCTYQNTGICESGMISCGVSTSADYTPAFELGRLAIYDIIEGVTAVEVTVERHLGAFNKTLWGQITGNSLAAAISVRPKVDLVAIDDQTLSCGFTVESFLQCTGLYITGFNVSYPLDGTATETMTFTGTHLEDSATTWSSAIISPTGTAGLTAYSDNGNAVVTRKDLSGGYQSVTAGVTIGRRDLFEFGATDAFHKAAEFPIESTISFEKLATKETQLSPAGGTGGQQSFDRITIGSAFLTATEYSGGGAGGGDATITETYTGYNDFQCTN